MIILLGALVAIAAAVVLVIGMISGAFALVYTGLALAGGGVVLLLIARYLGRSHHPALSEEAAPLPVSERSGSAGEVGREVIDPTSAFPIVRYDSLWVTQIVPRLAGLSADELAMVDARERGGRHRAGVLDAIAAIRRGEEPAPAEPAPEVADHQLAPATDEAGPAEQPEPDDSVHPVGPHDEGATGEPAGVAPVLDEVVPTETDMEPIGADERAGRMATFLGRLAAPIHVHRS